MSTPNNIAMVDKCIQREGYLEEKEAWKEIKEMGYTVECCRTCAALYSCERASDLNREFKCYVELVPLTSFVRKDTTK